MCFVFCIYSIYFFFFSAPFIGFPGFPSHPKTQFKKKQKSKIQTPKSRSKNVEACLPYTCLPNTCVCPTASSPKAQAFEPPLTIHFDEKIELFAPYFSCHQSCDDVFLCRSLDFPSHPKTPPKKSREFPLGDPSPCGKTGLASCRQCTFSMFLHSFFGYLFLFVFYVYITFYVFPFFLFIFFLCRSLDFPSHPKTQFKKKKQKSKIQTPDQKASKRVCPTRVCPTRVSAQQLRPQRLKHLNPLLPFILMNKLSCLPHIFPVIKAAMMFFCAVHWISHHIPKHPQKNHESSP